MPTATPIPAHDVEAQLEKTGDGSRGRGTAGSGASLRSRAEALFFQFQTSQGGRILFAGMALLVYVDITTDVATGKQMLEKGQYGYAAAVFGILFMSFRYQLLFFLCFPPEAWKGAISAYDLEEDLAYHINGDIRSLLLMYIPGTLPVLCAEETFRKEKAAGEDPDNVNYLSLIAEGIIFEIPFSILCLLCSPLVVIYEIADGAFTAWNTKETEFFAQTDALQVAAFRGAIAQLMEAVFESGGEGILQTHIWLEGEVEDNLYFISITMSIISIVKTVVLFAFAYKYYTFTAKRMNETLENEDYTLYAEKLKKLLDAPSVKQAELHVQKLGGLSVKQLLEDKELDVSKNDLHEGDAMFIADVLSR
jgi:hypothetical protein